MTEADAVFGFDDYADIADRLRLIDVALWNRGQAPEYKAVPRHRTRTVFY